MKQQLQVKFKNTPTDTSLVCSSVSSVLNRDESLSVQNKVLSCNNPEVNLAQHTVRQNLRVSDIVYVLNMRGKPLMPTSFRKAKLLVKQGRAKLIKSYPLTIQLCYATGEAKQEVTLGIDTGYENIGFSAVSEKEELLSGIVKLENNMSKRLIEKKMYRRNRRNKLWYREPRFNNRKNKVGKLPPSVERRVDTHVELVKRICKLLPITTVNIEVANFDIQKINNPDIKEKGYQQGSLYSYENIKAFVVAREQGRCQLCGKEYDNNGWHLHHIIQRSETGTDKPDNLALLHHKCHDKIHKQKLFTKLKEAKQYKAETFMSTTRLKILERIKDFCSNVNVTYGYVTKVKRVENNIEKTHNNDAFVIAAGNNQKRSIVYSIEQKKHNNRCLQTNRKGYKPSIRRKRSLIQPKDLFWVDGIGYRAKTMFSYGKYVLYGDVKKKEYFNTEKIKKYFNVNSWQFILLMKEHGVFLSPRRKIS